MKSQLFLAGALALALLPGAALFSGCGGGGGSVSTPDLRFTRQSNVEFPDAPEVSGVLTVNFADSAPNVNARATGTLQLYATPRDTAPPPPFPDAAPGAGTGDFLSVVPANATYILVGDVVPANGADADIALDLRGSYESSPRFTLRGNFVNDATIALEARFERGNSVLRGRITNVNNAVLPPRPTPTAGATTGATTAGATTTGATTTGATTTGATTTGATTTGATTAGATTAGATTAGATTAGATTAGATTAGATTAGATTAGATTAGATTAGATTAGAATAGATTTGATTVGLPPSVP